MLQVKVRFIPTAETRSDKYNAFSRAKQVKIHLRFHRLPTGARALTIELAIQIENYDFSELIYGS